MGDGRVCRGPSGGTGLTVACWLRLRASRQRELLIADPKYAGLSRGEARGQDIRATRPVCFREQGYFRSPALCALAASEWRGAAATAARLRVLGASLRLRALPRSLKLGYLGHASVGRNRRCVCDAGAVVKSGRAQV